MFRLLISSATLAALVLALSLAVADEAQQNAEPQNTAAPAEQTTPDDVQAADPKPEESKPEEAQAAAEKPAADEPADEKPATLDGITGELTYTTYFYTAGEAIIHGFENDTKVRIISMDKKGTVYTGTIDRMQTKTVETGAGVFSFVASKKASILVGTPTSCAVVGYWLRDQEGNFRAQQLFTQLPSSAADPDCRVVVWAWEDVKVDVNDYTADKILGSAEIKAGKYYELKQDVLAGIGSHVVNFTADKPAISVQVYYDEGFTVPSSNGSNAGKLFYTYAGKITEGVNDVSMISYYTTAKVKVEDVNTGEEIWAGEVAKGDIHTLTLKERFVKVTSDVDISVQVVAYEHYKGGYAEHHLGNGGEGTGIETEFLITTPQELWIFAYYPGTDVRVVDVKTDREVWSGKLSEGEVRGVHPGHGFYRVTASKGVATMAGASSCGCQFSSAANQFAVDEALFKVVQEIREARIEQAAKNGEKLSEEQLNAPLSDLETKQANQAVRDKTGRGNYTDGELQDRLRAIQQQQQAEKDAPQPTPAEGSPPDAKPDSAPDQAEPADDQPQTRD